MIAVVVNLGFAPEHIGDPGGAGIQVVAEMEMFAVAGPVLHHTGLAIDGFPAVMAGQTQGIAVAGHDAFVVAESATDPPREKRRE